MPIVVDAAPVPHLIAKKMLGSETLPSSPWVNAMLPGLESSIPHWHGAGLSDVGLLRSSNQDAFLVDNDLGLWVVADGMGGRAGGNIASSLTVKALLDHFHHSQENGEPFLFEQSNGEASFELRQAIQEADAAIRQRALEDPALSGMGTTIVAMLVSSLAPLQVVIGHVGDSRAYLCRGQELRLLTRDHSLVADLLARGHIAPAEAASHPQRHILVRALGIEGQTDPDISNQAVQSEDILLLCTDGITNMLSDREIIAHLTLAAESPDEACKGLVVEANSQGGKDNSTAVVIRFS
ncbi:MAG: Stp1/IreP family PP2C-type Ser/Thr phosphatase [Nitrospira sp.]|nr:Stp1/IreP family PP2C-type Ser/Thr phosphatase [Nitrospira sp.]